MMDWAEGGHFDVDLLKQFIRCVGIYPVGTLVRLEDGRLAVVIEQHPGNLLRPVVRVFFSTRGNCHVAPEAVDLARPGAERIVSDEAPERWGVDPMRVLKAA
jgi:hypothetical protein